MVEQLITRTSSPASGFSLDQVNEPSTEVNRFHFLRAVGGSWSAALDLAWVAAGRFDGFWERNLQSWDIAAGIVLVREAGGMISELDGGDVLQTGSILAANVDLHPKLEKQIRHAGSFGKAASV